ncbi:MAG: heme ABC exporter ATP-binding protein CcmA [Cucumibacter sp.]
MSAPAAFPPVALTVEGLACRRGDLEVFAGVSFTLAPGAALLVTGENGAGKSTLLMALAGLLRPTAGRIQWSGLGPDMLPRDSIHHLGHLSAVKPSLTVAENLGFWRDLYGLGDIGPALAQSGLAGLAHFPAGFLSAGQMRRLGLARLAAVPRPVWLVDEPATGLDEAGAAWVNRLIAAHLDRGGIAVVATHQRLALTGVAETLSLAGRRAA